MMCSSATHTAILCQSPVRKSQQIVAHYLIQDSSQHEIQVREHQAFNLVKMTKRLKFKLANFTPEHKPEVLIFKSTYYMKRQTQQHHQSQAMIITGLLK